MEKKQKNLNSFSSGEVLLDAISLSRWIDSLELFTWHHELSTYDANMFWLMQRGEYSNDSVLPMELVAPEHYEEGHMAWESYANLLETMEICEQTRIEDVLLVLHNLAYLDIDFNQEYKVNIWW